MTKLLRDLVRFRRRALTQAQTARKMKVSRQYVNNIESGLHHPSAKTIERYSKAIGAKILVVER